MWDQIVSGLQTYNEQWNELVSDRKNKAFFTQLKPVAVGWKVADREEYDEVCKQLHDDCDRIIETWMNGRWIAKLHLKESTLPGDIRIIKVMQRRPDSNDALGLDHVDFYSKDVAIDNALQAEGDLGFSTESNDVIAGYEWTSLWFKDSEAKIKADTVMDIIIKELEEINTEIKA